MVFQCCHGFSIYTLSPLPNHLAGTSQNHLIELKTDKPNQFGGMSDNNPESPVDDRNMLLEVGWAWSRIVGTVQGTQTQDYEHQSGREEANGEVLTLPTREQIAVAWARRNRRRAIHPVLEEFGAFREFAAIMSATHGGHHQADEEEEGSGIQFSPCQVEDFLQTLARVEISTLGTDDVKCSICKLEYGKGRGNTTEPASNSGQGLPGEETPEYPVKLSCGHVFGDWCIKTWLLVQPASCPICRFQFQPVR